MFSSGQGPVLGSSQPGAESSGFRTGGDFFSTSQLLSAPQKGICFTKLVAW